MFGIVVGLDKMGPTGSQGSRVMRFKDMFTKYTIQYKTALQMASTRMSDSLSL